MQDGWKTRRDDRGLHKILEIEPLAREILRLPTWTEKFDLVRHELGMIIERDVLSAPLSDFLTARRMSMGMSKPMLMPSVQSREVVEQQQKLFMQGCDTLFVGYTAAAHFHSSEVKINCWTTVAKKIRGSMPPRCHVLEVSKVLQRSLFEKNAQYMMPAE